MERLLFLGERQFILKLRGARRDDPHASSLVDRHAALALLRRLALDPGNLAQLRGVLAGSALASHRSLDDQTLIDHLANLLLAGRAIITQSPAVVLPGLDGPDDDAPSAPISASAPRAALTWIEIQLLDEDDEPVPGAAYRIELPDGSSRQGRVDVKGLARIEGIDPAECIVTFPDLDRDAWTRI